MHLQSSKTSINGIVMPSTINDKQQYDKVAYDRPLSI